MEQFTVRDFSCQAALPACERNSGTWHLGKKKKDFGNWLSFT
jgi:hypothetical protein